MGEHVRVPEGYQNPSGLPKRSGGSTALSESNSKPDASLLPSSR